MLITEKMLFELDDYLKNNINEISCHEVYKLYKSFVDVHKEFCGTDQNLTGITEFLIHRLCFHIVNTLSIELKTSKFFYTEDKKNQKSPDVTFIKDDKIIKLISVKANNKVSTSILYEDIDRIQRIRHEGNGLFDSLTIIFIDAVKKTVQNINKDYEWHTYLYLKDNNSLFINEISEKLKLNLIN